MLYKRAIEDAVQKTHHNLLRFKEQFPHVGTYETGYSQQLNANDEWTNGFWTGLQWLCYEYTKNDVFKDSATANIEQFHKRLTQNLSLEHHDIGFLYSLSTKAHWIIERDEVSRLLTIHAADKLLSRFRKKAQMIQAWGAIGDPTEGGRMIIDCLLNLPLLYWASEITGDERYRNTAEIHAEQSRRYLVRGDDSSYHTFFFNQETGEPLGGCTHQGYHNGSTWTRGQAWGVYGFALSYRYTGEIKFLETAKRMAHFFLAHLPDDLVAYWDLDAPKTPDIYRDSSASAIVCSGLHELLQHMSEDDPDYAYFHEKLHASLTSLIKNYSTMKEPDAEGLIKHGSYSVRGGNFPDGYMIWGDYFYLEALMRVEHGINGYWYERSNTSM